LLCPAYLAGIGRPREGIACLASDPKACLAWAGVAITPAKSCDSTSPPPPRALSNAPISVRCRRSQGRIEVAVPCPSAGKTDRQMVVVPLTVDGVQVGGSMPACGEAERFLCLRWVFLLSTASKRACALVQVALCDLCVQSVLAMGFTMGVMHCEAKYTSNSGAQLIEVTHARDTYARAYTLANVNRAAHHLLHRLMHAVPPTPQCWRILSMAAE
jgi:hypothetical protein